MVCSHDTTTHPYRTNQELRQASRKACPGQLLWPPAQERWPPDRHERVCVCGECILRILNRTIRTIAGIRRLRLSRCCRKCSRCHTRLPGVKSGDAIGECRKRTSDRRLCPALKGRTKTIAKIERWRRLRRRRPDEGGVSRLRGVETGNAVGYRGERTSGRRLCPTLKAGV